MLWCLPEAININVNVVYHRNPELPEVHRGVNNLE